MCDLRNMTVEDAKDWYGRWYVPNNVTMAVAGDVEPRQVCALARKHFGPTPSRSGRATRSQDEAPQRGVRRVTVKAPAENPHVAIAFKAPTLRDVEKDEDVYALEMLAAVLDGYDNARLNARLVRTDRGANSANAEYSNISHGPSLFILSGTPTGKTTTQELKALMRAEIAHIAKEGMSAEELERIKTRLIASQIYRRDSTFGQAMEIGVMEISGIPHTKIDRIIRVRSLWMATRTARINALRGFCREFGISVATGSRNGLEQISRVLADPASTIPTLIRGTMKLLVEEIQLLEARVAQLERELTALAKQSPACTTLLSIPGIGLLTATAMVAATSGNVSHFKDARHFASWFGLTPKEHSSGTTRKLGRISKKEERYLRMLLTHGARSVLRAASVAVKANRQIDGLRTWALDVQSRANHNKAACALANKLARICYATLRDGEIYGGSVTRMSQKLNDPT